MAKSKTVEEDLDDLDLDDLDEIDEEVDEDEEVEEDDEDDEDEDPDEAPKAKRGRKTKAKAKSSKPKKTGIGTKELADAAGVTSRELRQFLRASSYQPRDEREGRYSWPSVRDPEAREIIKAVKSGAVAKMNKEKVDELKGKRKAKATSGKKKTSARKKKS
jgi:hypothetical protein